jgi:L-2,4-diaminobutyric acid acetyltransferase
VADAASIWRLVRDTGVLDVNSPYCYLLVCRDFAATSLVACVDGAIVGCALAYRPPPQPDTLFVWQIGVAAAARGRGLGRRLLAGLLALPAARDVTHLTATVTPENVASRRLFAGFARGLGVACVVDPAAGFAAELFDGGHEREDAIRIGPLAGANVPVVTP